LAYRTRTCVPLFTLRPIVDNSCLPFSFCFFRWSFQYPVPHFFVVMPWPPFHPCLCISDFHLSPLTAKIRTYLGPASCFFRCFFVTKIPLWPLCKIYSQNLYNACSPPMVSKELPMLARPPPLFPVASMKTFFLRRFLSLSRRFFPHSTPFATPSKTNQSGAV